MARLAQTVPKIGLVMEAVKVVRWLSNVGDTVRQGEPLVEVETEKSVVEIEAAADGRLIEILKLADDEAMVGDQIAWIDTGEADASSAQPVPASSPPPPTPRAVPSLRAAPAQAGGRVPSSPVARKLAAAHGVDLGGLSGTGPHGRIQLADVHRAIEAPASTGTALTPMRRALARAMSLSNATVPQFFVERSVDWTAVAARRSRLPAASPPGSPTPSINDFLLQAVARALLEHPDLNATFSGNADTPGARIVHAAGAHIGLVVAVDGGLRVPVIHGVDALDLAEIARRRSACVERALQGRLRREELEGATISISNLGTRGPDRFTAIVSPPQSAILAVGRQRDTLVVRDGVVVARPHSVLTLTVDHRVADGRLASDFLARLVELLEVSDGL